MSVFGGDSWAREAQCRKRRVDELMVDNIDSSAYKKLSSGKFVCIVCSHRPVLDTPLMLSVHVKGSSHRAAETRLRERELGRQDEINKRIALSECDTATSKTLTSSQLCRSASKPLIGRTRKAASDVLHQNLAQSTASQGDEIKCTKAYNQERRERELKFTSAGWKRDGHGKWFKEENVEFDSDEEEPNLCLP
ncbi:sodium channel modifier 1-like isoform X2 [Solanum pennellii]|uniref:Sodium channel modifier 1 n=1 Tax=Solanum pennellii TaxID=28526 RepID=A0ABM1HRN3_SOLPN|nr:sodium channel modifier 1-like isoform X2 [Solanum pennellii]